ncbi:MAG: selenium metabolism-associated LysR family transcriptional regulator [Defluviitaleaceae bacterium]|nr:selenium metabolism-associated LysR family transcriptional regulator [Defluviitaleaceae bacterium]
MDFKQIEAYVQVIEHGSFSKAAEAIFMSQPSVSTYINALERELATKLISRSTKEISPTLAGKIFYENAKELLTLKHNTVERIRNLSGSFVGEIKILASSVPAQYILPEVLAGFADMYPNISFIVKQADTLEVSRSIATQKAELGFSGGVIEDSKCDFKEFMTEQMVLIAPCDKGFTDSDAYSLESLLYQYRFLSREKGSGTRTQYEAFFAEENIDIKKVDTSLCFDNTQSIINGVISGLGISMVSEFAARAFIKKKMVIPLRLKEKLPVRKLYYVLKRGFAHSHLIDLFIEFLASWEGSPELGRKVDL